MYRGKMSVYSWRACQNLRLRPALVKTVRSPEIIRTASFQPNNNRNFSSILIQFPKTSIIAPISSRFAVRTSIFGFFSVIHRLQFHTSLPRKALIPPAFWLLFRPVANLAGVLFGRLCKKLWKKMPQDKRDKVIFWFQKHKSKFLGTIGLTSLGVLVFILAHIEEVPYTKRRRYNLFSHEEVKNIFDEAQEDISLQLQEMYQSRTETYYGPSHPFYQSIKNVMDVLMEANREEILQCGVTSWKLHVVHAPSTINAMVFPNGTVYVYSGIIDLCSSDDEIAAILAHEIAHVLLNHVGEELSRQSLLDTASILFITAIWSMLPDVAAFLSHAFLSKASSLLIDLPFSRCMETEADLVGVNLAAKACFDVREASVFWNKLAFLEEVDYLGTQLELLSTHPSHQKRSTAIDELIPGALKFRELCKCCSVSSIDPRDEFSTFKEQILKEAETKG